MKKIILLLSLLTVLMLATVSAEVYESGTYQQAQENFWFTGFGDFGSAFQFTLPANATIIEDLTMQFYSCEGDSGQGDPATSPTKIAIRSVLNEPYNASSEDLWSYTFSDCSQIDIVSNGTTVDWSRGFYTFPVDLEITGGSEYYVVIGTTETYQGASTGGNLPYITESIDPYIYYFDGNSVWNLQFADEGFYNERYAWFNLTYTVPTPPTGGLTPYTPTHGISSVTGLVIDFGVEMGVQYILFAGLIAIIGLGIWGYSIYRRGGM